MGTTSAGDAVLRVPAKSAHLRVYARDGVGPKAVSLLSEGFSVDLEAQTTAARVQIPPRIGKLRTWPTSARISLGRYSLVADGHAANREGEV
jgi:hypothetical protein